ncbi:MAG: PIG-L deacetylase family protein [Fimbriimonadales bacterium]
MTIRPPLRVLAVGAHPDDIEILCAGTLARCRARGDTVVMCIATNGDKGHKDIKPPALARIREAEARASATMLGAELIWLGFEDEFIYPDHDTRLRFVQMIREARPDIIITHHPEDYHQDHRTVSELVFVSSFVAAIPNVETATANHGKIPALYYMDTLGGVGFMPSEYVNVTDTMALKCDMLRCHKSQLEWLHDYNGIDILDFMEVVARFRGLACGVRHAEGYTKAEVWPRVGAERVLP